MISPLAAAMDMMEKPTARKFDTDPNSKRAWQHGRLQDDSSSDDDDHEDDAVGMTLWTGFDMSYSSNSSKGVI